MKPIPPRIEAVRDFRPTLLVILLFYICGVVTAGAAANWQKETDVERRLRVLDQAREDQRQRNEIQNRINEQFFKRLK